MLHFYYINQGGGRGYATTMSTKMIFIHQQLLQPTNKFKAVPYKQALQDGGKQQQQQQVQQEDQEQYHQTEN